MLRQRISTNGQHGLIGGPILLQSGRIVVGRVAFTGLNGRGQMMLGMQNDELFAHTFD
ncbi:MAG: hypothetical protein ABI411_07700 [Tahibacter sp.]